MKTTQDDSEDHPIKFICALRGMAPASEFDSPEQWRLWHVGQVTNRMARDERRRALCGAWCCLTLAVVVAACWSTLVAL